VGKTLAVEQGNEAGVYELVATILRNGVKIGTCVPTQLISTLYILKSIIKLQNI